MQDIAARYHKMFTMDELSDRNTAINGINPIIKLAVALIYILCVVSYDKYDISGLTPLFLYPVILITAGDIPLRPVFSGMAAAAPFVIGAGIFNPLLDREIVMTISGLDISAGMLSFVSLLIKCALTVSAAILLLASTGINRLAAALHRLHIPQVFIIQLLLTYRYISVLMEEASRMNTAYTLRAPGQKGINIKVWGSLIGSLLLRTYDRAVRLYHAMKLRGFDSRYYGVNIAGIKKLDIMYLTLWTMFFAAIKFVDIPGLIGIFTSGGLQ